MYIIDDHIYDFDNNNYACCISVHCSYTDVYYACASNKESNSNNSFIIDTKSYILNAQNS